MRFLKIIKGKISVADVGHITFEMLQQEVGGFVEKHTVHVGMTNRYLILYVNADAKLKGQYKNFIWQGQWIAGHAVIVAEKRDGSYLNLSDHEFQSLKFIDRELFSLMPTHQGYTSHRRPDAE